MILVTGTKRSGTSMWMQILIAAGLPAIGEAFPRRWDEQYKDANPAGFFESTLRHGVYYRTNPHPETGVYLFPEAARHHVVKVFIPGLVRTDRAFIERVIATVRPWREYVSSMRRLNDMEDQARREKHPDSEPIVRMPAHLEWWYENFALICDLSTRRYPVHVQSYDGLLAQPRAVLERVLAWIGRGELESALAAIRPELRTQRDSDVPPELAFDDEAAALCDELYARLDGRGLEPTFIQRMNAINDRLQPRVLEHMLAVRRGALRRRQRQLDGAREGALGDLAALELEVPPGASDFDLLEGLE